MYVTLCVFYFFFFFKQKTAYEMRISDWSSDVCSSDLWRGGRRTDADGARAVVQRRGGASFRRSAARGPGNLPAAPAAFPEPSRVARSLRHAAAPARRPRARCRTGGPLGRPPAGGRRRVESFRCNPARSAENTSELQLLMRISYAVIFLK